jgi:putative metallohydrolase (TIGR04338 family)
VDSTSEIRLSSLRETVVLHEIAHVVTPGAGHGPAFVDTLLALVRERLGFHTYGALLAELHRRDVVERDRA